MNFPKYTPHKDRCIRINSAYTAIQAILFLDLYPVHKRELLDVCIWKITEADGKFNTRFRSIGTLDEKSLRHEHVVERKSIIDRLLLEPDNYYEILNDAIACIVSKDEHDKLTAISKKNRNLSGWERYKAADIRVFDLLSGNELV